MRKYKVILISLFKDFLSNKVTKEDLIAGLHRIEKSMSKITTNKTMWFKFYYDDTSATDINDFKNDIGSTVNDKHIRDNMKIVIENPTQFRIFFS